MDLFSKQALKMKSKRGVIPMRIWNRLVDTIYALSITHVEGGRLVRGKGFGTSLVINPSPSGSTEEVLPLQIVAGPSGVGFYKITPGTVNGEMPTLSATDLDDATPPEFEVTETEYVWLKVVGTFGTGGSPDTYVVTVEVDNTGSPPAGTAITATTFTSFYLIGSVDFVAGTPNIYTVTNNHPGGDLLVDSWGLYNQWELA